MFQFSPWLRVEIKKEGGKLPTFMSRARRTAENLTPAAFDPRSVDIDSDGWHQEGTTARWFGIGTDNPLYKRIKKAAEGLDSRDEEPLMEAARRAEDLWGAPDPLSSSLEADTSWIGGWQTQYARGAPITDAAVSAAARAVRGRELLRERGKRFEEAPDVPETTEAIQVNREVAKVAEEVQSSTKKFESSAKEKIQERLKKEEELRKRSRDLVTEDELDAVKGFDPFDFDTISDADNSEEYNDWLAQYNIDNPGPDYYNDGYLGRDDEFQIVYEKYIEELDQAWEDHERGSGPKRNEGDETLFDKASEMFNFEFETKDGKKFSLGVDEVVWDGAGEMRVDFIVYDERGNPAGSATRTFDFDNKVVSHDILKINKEHRGSGISSIINSRNEQIYAAMGMERIHVGALSSSSDYNGVTHWPKVGFDWEDDQERAKFLDEINNALTNYFDEVKNNPGEMPTITIKMERNENGTLVVDFLDVPMFSSPEEAEELSLMLLQATQEDFDAEDRLTSMEFVQWPGAEAWFKKKSNSIDYSRTIAPLSGDGKKDLHSLLGMKVKVVEGKIGGAIGKVQSAKLKPAVFDPDSVDVDSDGWHQEGTTVAWFGAGLNNPMVEALRNRVSNFGEMTSDGVRDEFVSISRRRSAAINAPKPEESNLAADLSFIVGHRINRDAMTADIYEFVLDEDASWIIGREQERRGPSEASKPIRTLATPSKSRIAEFKKKIEERKKTRIERDEKLKARKGVQVDERTLERARNFVLNESPDLELYKMFGFDFEDRNGKKYTTQVERVSSGNVIGKIVDENGDDVANFHRIFDVDDEGRLYVEHKLLTVNQNYRDSGVAAAFNARNEQVYSALGVVRIDAGAVSDPYNFNGSSHWPKVGFDWSNDYYRDLMLKTIEKALDDYEKGVARGEVSPTFRTIEVAPDGRILDTNVETPIFPSREEAEELATLVAMARDQAFDDNNRLVAADFVNWTSAEWWMKMESFGTEYSKPVASDPKRVNKLHKQPVPYSPPADYSPPPGRQGSSSPLM